MGCNGNEDPEGAKEAIPASFPFSMCDPHQFQHRLACRMVMKDLSSPSKCHVNIYNIWFDGGKKPSVTIQTLRWMVQLFWMATKNFYHHPNTETDTEIEADHRRFFTNISAWPHLDAP